MTKSRKIGIYAAIALVFVLALATIIPLHTVHHDVASAVTVQSHDEWVNSYSGTYYNNLNEDLTGNEFRKQLASLTIREHHTQTVYNGSSSLALNNVWPKSDIDSNGQLIWFYTGTKTSPSNFGGSGGQTNREHVWAKNGNSTFGADQKEAGAGADAHHLRPAEVNLNASRGNLGFGEVTQSNSNIVAQNGSTSYGTFPDGLCFKSGSFFYPAKGYRGATARILMYMQVRYGDELDLYFVNSATTSDGKGIGKISDLFKWHLEEPPTDEEIFRNNVIAGIQGNRNPFIDHPEYAEMIYCNDGKSYNNTLKNLVAQYGSYLDNTNSGGGGGGGTDTPNPTPTLQSLTLSKTSLTMTVGTTSQITVTANPSTASNDVTWSSSNTTVARVNNGLITAVGLGTATITATSTVNTSIKASLTVTVNASQRIPNFEQKVDAIGDATTLEGRYDAISSAIEAYKLLTSNEKVEVATYYAKLQEAIQSYNDEINGINGELQQATNISAQAIALCISTAFLALVLIVVKQTVGR